MSRNNTVDTSRRHVLASGVAVLAAGVGAVVAARTAKADDKLAQDVVQYRQSPGDDGSKCSACVNWEAPSSCKIVAGTINPNGWCVAFAPKG